MRSPRRAAVSRCWACAAPSSRQRGSGARDEHVVWWLPGEPSTRTRAGAASPRACRTSPIAAAPPACRRILDKLLKRGRLGRHRVRRHIGRLGAATGARPLCRPQRPAAADLRLAQSRGKPARPGRREPAAVSSSARPSGSTPSRSRGWNANSSTRSTS